MYHRCLGCCNIWENILAYIMRVTEVARDPRFTKYMSCAEKFMYEVFQCGEARFQRSSWYFKLFLLIKQWKVADGELDKLEDFAIYLTLQSW